ncbi:PD-(D/E)XK nuclease family protein [Bradyrhizobium yuanmingense]|nr:PD-(D/E)XK nuclease family protein [Bradyrhizobium yuanmingense]
MTECTADLFNRLDASAQKQLIRRAFLPASIQSQWDIASSAIDALRMETQYAFLSGRIDLVVFADDNPLIAIENKIDAPIGAGKGDDDQLATYGQWIVSTNQSSFPAVVCLLTHIREPSEDFLDGGKKSGGATPHVLKWGLLSAILKDVAGGLVADTTTLISELLLFLGEMNMDHDFAGRDDFAAALVYLRAGSRMDHTFDTIYQHVKKLPGCFATGSSIHEMSLHYDTKYSLIWGWKYLSHPSLSGLFFGYGIALSPALTFAGAAAPTRDAVFLCVGAEGNRSMQALRHAKDIPEKPWTFADLGEWSAVICFKSFHSFMADPEKFAPQMIEWINEISSDVNEFVASNLK